MKRSLGNSAANLMWNFEHLPSQLSSQLTGLFLAGCSLLISEREFPKRIQNIAFLYFYSSKFASSNRKVWQTVKRKANDWNGDTKDETFWRHPLPTLPRQTIDVTTSLFLRLFSIRNGRKFRGTGAHIWVAQSALAESKSAKKISAAFLLEWESRRPLPWVHPPRGNSSRFCRWRDDNAKLWQEGEGRKKLRAG